MRVVVVTPPSPVVLLDEAKAHLRMDDTDAEGALIEAYIAAAIAHLDGPEGWLGRAIGQQVLEVRLDAFEQELRLPFPPVIEVQAISYVTTAGDTVTLDASAYETAGAVIMPAYASHWPAARYHRETVRIRYRAGYKMLPPAIRAALLLMIGDLYGNRETVETGVRAAAVTVPMSTTVQALLAPYRVYS